MERLKNQPSNNPDFGAREQDLSVREQSLQQQIDELDAKRGKFVEDLEQFTEKKLTQVSNKFLHKKLSHNFLAERKFLANFHSCWESIKPQFVGKTSGTFSRAPLPYP